jgi:glycosyltransferase involved in cell wall biosynthesis
VKLSVIIPVFNEVVTLETLLDRIAAVELPVAREIIIVDDGSTDGTRALVERLKTQRGLQTCFHRENQGKGAAIRTGLAKATGDIVLIQDGDLEYDPADYTKLIQPIVDKQTRVVYGSRILGKGKMSYLRYYLGGRFLSLLANMIYRIHITDEPTCYKVFDASLLKRMDLEAKGFEFCPEVTAKTSRLGEPIVEVPISYTPRSIEEGKKISLADGIIAIWTLLRYARWQPTDEGSKA